MRKLLLPLAAILALGVGLAVAQNITKSVQLSQDSTGAIGFDVNSNVYFPAHILNNGSAPSLGAGLSTASLNGTDWAGTITGTAASNAGTIVFKTAYLATPACLLMATNPATSPVAYNVVPTGINVTTWTGALVANYICTGKK